jgi:hypothetical protein
LKVQKGITGSVEGTKMNHQKCRRYKKESPEV